MIGIVIVAHGGLASGYLAALEHVVGTQPDVLSVDIHDDHDRKQKEAEIKIAADRVDSGDGVVMVTDMHGGSPHNLSLPACRVGKRVILHGANMPMLVKLVRARSKPLEFAVGEAVDSGRKYLDCCGGS